MMVRVDLKLKYVWEDCTIGFKCPRCGELLVADSQDGEKECDCGVKYRLDYQLVVDIPGKEIKPGEAGKGKNKTELKVKG